MDIRKYLLERRSPTFAAYYNGLMSYRLHGKSWLKFVEESFPDIGSLTTSENVFKDAVDLYAENLTPSAVPELRGFDQTALQLLMRGQAPVVVLRDGSVSYPEHYEMVSDGDYSACVIFTRSLQAMEDYATFVWSDGRTELWAKPVPEGFSAADRHDYKLVETRTGATLLRFALADNGLGAQLASLQDRVNHSVVDQTVVAEMRVRPFWYLLNTVVPPKNPFLPKDEQDTPMQELRNNRSTQGSAGRIFTTSSGGPFGQLTPPTIDDMVGYHDSIIAKVSQTTGIPGYYFKPGSGTVPTGVALKVLSQRFTNKVARMRDSIEPQLRELAALLGVPAAGELELWPAGDDLLQDALDSHGLALTTMGYPFEYIAEVVTPGADLDQYQGSAPDDHGDAVNSGYGTDG